MIIIISVWTVQQLHSSKVVKVVFGLSDFLWSLWFYANNKFVSIYRWTVKNQYCGWLTSHDFIRIAPKRQLGWLNLPRSPTLPPPVTAKHRVVKVKNWMRESSFVRRNCDIHSAIKLSETEFSQLWFLSCCSSGTCFCSDTC